MQIPILILGDSPGLHTGLSRITRDLAVLLSGMPEFRVGTLGRGGYGNRNLPWMQYNFPEQHQWGEGHIERVWKNFAGNQKGIIFTIWDASRLLWFSCPQPEDELLPFLSSGSFSKWGYFPVDSTGVNDRLTDTSRAAIAGFDRVLGYGAWGAQILSNGLGREVDWMPHGIDGEKFQPRDRKAARMAFGFKDDDVVVGCVMTNQARKDWGLAFGAFSRFSANFRNSKFIGITDAMLRSWSIPALVADFGLNDRVQFRTSGSMTDEEMSYFYSACDLTILPSTEGFGYPIVESLSCGTPVIHGAYGGGAELVPHSEWLVNPVAHRMETPHNVIRPVFNPHDWSTAMQETASPSLRRTDDCRSSVEHLMWSNLGEPWRKWFREGS